MEREDALHVKAGAGELAASRDAAAGAGAGATPAVSVVIPAYNVATYMRETLDSVFAQTYTDFEVVVVNDGSPDTEELERALEPYRERIVYVRQENRGAGAARNRGLREARGGYVAFLDADDLWLPNFLEAQMRFLEAGGYDLVYSDAVLFGDTPVAGRTQMESASPSVGEVDFLSLIHYRCNVTTSTVLARKAPIFEAGLFDEGLRNSQDFELWVRLVRRGARVSYQRKVLVRYRCHDDSLSSGTPVNQVRRQIYVFEKMGERFDLAPDERAEFSRVLEKLRAELELELGKEHLARGDYAGARESLGKANSFQPRVKLRAVLLLLSVAPRLLARLYAWRTRRVQGALKAEASGSL
jgi:glycosyltransferase involved in cell wall biosynthesis